ncbi:olfactory receptor 5J3-like [Ambystoma mexicanum]|uniref:olfactory receptor 5J3-like n=1 Tax=Ambystoma mexicanum TaxID=8296 RepID=UPI0037E98236
MEAGNGTVTKEFLIVGFSEIPELQVPLFVLLLWIYLITVVGNLVVLSIIYFNPQLHKPMYYFLAQMSFLDMCSISVTLPKAMAVHLTGLKTISFTACIVQLYFFLFFVSTESALLAVMAYDRYVAICNPLHYNSIMSRKTCVKMAAISWLVGVADAVPHPLLTSRFSFCGPLLLRHFFCDLTALMKLTCSDTFLMVILTFALGAPLGIGSTLLIMTSYVLIICTILNIRSAVGRRRAFSTCSAHLTAVLLFYMTIFCSYLRPMSRYSQGEDQLYSVFYAVLIPMLNPLIYTLRNKEVKKAFEKACGKTIHFQET